MAPVSGPPVLGIRHQGPKIGLETLIIKACEGLWIVEVISKWIGGGMMLMKDAQVDLIGPPVIVSGSSGGRYGTGMTTEGAFHVSHQTF